MFKFVTARPDGLMLAVSRRAVWDLNLLPWERSCACILTCWWCSSRTGTRCPCTSCAGGYAAIIAKVQGRTLNTIGLGLNCRAWNSLCGDRTLSFVTALLSREKLKGKLVG